MTVLAGNRVLITGAASGIGRRLALGSARRKAALVLWDVDAAGLERVAREIASEGANVQTAVVDVSYRKQVYAAARELQYPVHVLSNHAGVVSGKSFLDLPDEKIEPTFFATPAAFRRWLEKHHREPGPR